MHVSIHHCRYVLYGLCTSLLTTVAVSHTGYACLYSPLSLCPIRAMHVYINPLCLCLLQAMHVPFVPMSLCPTTGMSVSTDQWSLCPAPVYRFTVTISCKGYGCHKGPWTQQTWDTTDQDTTDTRHNRHTTDTRHNRPGHNRHEAQQTGTQQTRETGMYTWDTANLRNKRPGTKRPGDKTDPGHRGPGTYIKDTTDLEHSRREQQRKSDITDLEHNRFGKQETQDTTDLRHNGSGTMRTRGITDRGTQRHVLIGVPSQLVLWTI